MKQICNYLISIVFPQECVFCNKTKGVNNYICNICKEKILSKYVGYTRKNTKQYDNIIYVSNYRDLKKNILSYKFKYKKFLYRTFGELLKARLVENNIKPDYITGVPISVNRLKERGYNQTYLICEQISYEYCGKFEPILVKKVDNLRQSTFSKNDRKNNVKDVFVINDKIDLNLLNNKSILLIDDVYTTGETIKECIRILKNSRTNCRIYVAVIVLNNTKLIEVK